MNENAIRYRKRVVRRQHHLATGNHYENDDSSIASNNHHYQQQQQQQQQQRPAYVRKKPEGLICSICQGPAHGYNFDAITCESCKAFFRRNALKYDETFKCRTNNGHCIITVSTRKRCKSCRLAKCFEKGMRADWILTDEERLNKRQKIEENRRLRRLLYPDANDSDTISDPSCVDLKSEPVDNDDNAIPRFSSLLTAADVYKIQQIRQAYTDSVRLTSLPREIPAYPYTARLNAPWEMMNLPTNLQSSRVITFFKLIPEFSALNEHDKLVLVKYNTFTSIFIRSALIYDPVADVYHDKDTDDCVFAGKDLIQCFSLDQYQQSTRCVRRILATSHNDRFLIQVFLIIVVLSKGSAVCTYTEEPEPVAYDVLALLRAQNIFANLLWKYCVDKFGFHKTVDIWSKLTFSLIDAHLQSYNTRYKYARQDGVAEQLVPLMKSVMLNV